MLSVGRKLLCALGLLLGSQGAAALGGIILYQTSNWTGESLVVNTTETSNLGEVG